MNVPKLRFKEFTDEWKQTPLKNIIYSNIIEAPKPTTDYIRLGIRSHCKGTFHELVKIENILSADKMYIVPKNNLILNITFAWEQAIAITDDNDEGKYISNRFPTFAFKDNQLPTFYKYIIPQKRLKYDLNVASPGGAGRNRVLNKKLFLSIPVNIPLLKEQEKIAKFLTTVDKKITNLENIITSLENQKKGLLQQIFSQKLRFKDKNGNNYPNWKKKKLGDLFTIKAGGDINKENFSEQYSIEFKYPVYANALTNNGLYGYSNIYKIDKPSITVTGRGINVGFALSREPFYYPIVRLLVLIPNININFTFFTESINFIHIFNESTGVPQLTAPQLSKVNVYVPNIEEQNKIGNLFDKLNEKIDNKKAQLEHWQQIKKGLLQQMFV